MPYRSDERERNRPDYDRPPTLGAARHRPGEGSAQSARSNNAPQRSGAGAPPRNPRPSQRGGGRRPPKRRAQPRFFVLLAVLLAVVVAVVVLLVRARHSEPVAVIPTIPPSSSITQPALETTPEPDAMDEELADFMDPDDDTALLDDSQRVSVSDLSVNTSLPSDWMNVLLLGTDERISAEKGRTDSIIICSVNTTTGEVKLSSVMRDLAIDYGKLGYTDIGVQRVNAANFYGGPQMVMKTINANFGLNVQNYVLVNFYGFQDAVNALGGITMTITEAEMNKINVGQKQVAGFANQDGIDISGWDNEDLTEFGENVHLNGQQALAYARIRKLDSDYARTERQRNVLMAVLDEVKKKSPVEIMQLGATLMPYIQTNMTLDDILRVATVVIASNLDAEGLRLPVNGSYVQEERNGNDMLWDCDFVQNQQALYSFIYE